MGSHDNIFESLFLIVFSLLYFIVKTYSTTSDIIPNEQIYKRHCQSDVNCRQNERCQKVCFWLYPNDSWLGCNIVCVKLPPERVPFFVKLTDPPGRWSKVTVVAPDVDHNSLQETFSAKLNKRLSLNNDDAPRHLEFTPILTTCPTPPICQPACGIYVGIDGCQKCRCVGTGFFKCKNDFDCARWQVCYNAVCKCDRGYEESLWNPGQCLPLVLGSLKPAEKIPFLNLADLIGPESGMFPTPLPFERNSLQSGNGRISDSCQNDKDCISLLLCCIKVYCDPLNTCRREKLCLIHCVHHTVDTV